jgi:hypothetical protein
MPINMIAAGHCVKYIIALFWRASARTAAISALTSAMSDVNSARGSATLLGEIAFRNEIGALGRFQNVARTASACRSLAD